MAGIGFELKKLFVGRSLFQKARAYAYASMVCSGTTLLAVVLLVGLGRLAKWAGASPRESEVLVVLTVYAMLGSMLLTALLQMLLSRYTADMIYGKQYDRILPSLYGGTLLLMVPGGIAYAILLSQSHDISLINRALDWFLLMEMILVWLQMAYITAVKDYRRILLGFLFGVCAALIFGFVLLQAGISVITALLTATLMGYGVMAFCFSSVLHGYFSMGHGSVFH
ncbi:MAG: exopolysaccharide Pel transporter PelG, partial [Clostridia bacterium]